MGQKEFFLYINKMAAHDSWDRTEGEVPQPSLKKILAHYGGH